MLLSAVVAGCAPSPPPVPGSGAGEAAQEYYAAMLRDDWATAYATLDPASRQHLTGLQFAQRARDQRHAIGFEPKELHVRSCEEHGAEAIAHIVLSGETATGRRFYKDDIVLRRGTSGWSVVLSSHFGRPFVKRR